MGESFLNGCVLLHPGDCVDVLARLEECSVDSCVTDPPYHLTSIVQRFANARADREQYAATSNSAYMSRGFMGKVWDGGDVAFRPEIWRAVYRVLKPGAHLVACGGTRTYHRMACAIEDAGFEVRDTISWLYGSGFPKSHDVSKGIDRTRAETNRDLEFCEFMRSTKLSRDQAGRILQQAGLITTNGTMAGHFFAASRAGQPAIATRQIFETLRPYLGVDVPARIEEIINRMEAERQKIGERTSGIANGRNHYTVGGTFVDTYDVTIPATNAARQWEGWGTALKPACELIVLARKPLSEGTVAANVLRWSTGALNIDGCRVGTSKDVPASPRGPQDRIYGRYGAQNGSESGHDPNVGRWPANVAHDGSDEVMAVFPESGPSSDNPRNNTVDNPVNDSNPNATILGRKRATTTFGHADNGGSAARFFYTAKADADDRLGSKHPTVKPLDLMQWLVRMVTPPKGVCLDPFAGTGTTAEAAIREGMRAVLIEAEPEYQADIRRRMALVLAGPDERTRESIKAKNLPVDYGPLFGFPEAAE